MIHLKLYENYKKNNHNLIPEIQEFCDDYLAYLLDDEFKVVVKAFNEEIIIIITRNGDYETYDPYYHTDKVGGFHYDDINDTFIPFLSMLSEKYNVYTPMIRFTSKVKFGRGSNLQDYKLEELLNNENENLYKMFITNIEIWIGV